MFSRGGVLGHLGPGLVEGVVEDVEAAAREDVGEAVGLEAEAVGHRHLGQVAVGAADGGVARSSGRCGPGSSMTTEMKVDLPVPLRPTRPTFSPAPTTNEASRSRVRSPISMVREDPTIMGEGVTGPVRVDPGPASGCPTGSTGPSLPHRRCRVDLPSAGAAPQVRCGRTDARRRSDRAPRRAPGPGGWTMARKAIWWTGHSSPPVGHADQALGAQRPDLLDASGPVADDPEPEPGLAAEPRRGAQHQGLGLADLDGPPVDPCARSPPPRAARAGGPRRSRWPSAMRSRQAYGQPVPGQPPTAVVEVGRTRPPASVPDDRTRRTRATTGRCRSPRRRPWRRSNSVAVTRSAWPSRAARMACVRRSAAGRRRRRRCGRGAHRHLVGQALDQGVADAGVHRGDQVDPVGRQRRAEHRAP